MHMKVPPPLEHIRQNRAMYLGPEKPSGRALAIGLAHCALVSGASRVELLVLVDGWMAVCADADWITPNLQQHKDLAMERAFKSMIPLHGARPNEIRFEVIVTAFSRNLGVKSDNHWVAIIGKNPPKDIRDRVAGSDFSVVFQAEGDS
jgi:hypothetical protein